MSALRSFSGFRHFNPRSRKGATQCFRTFNPEAYISIHAPARERPSSSIIGLKSSDFNPRSRKGATAVAVTAYCSARISIHAPARERRCPQCKADYLSEFQSTLPQGSDLRRNHRYEKRKHFNPRSRKGATTFRRTQHRHSKFQYTLPQGSDLAGVSIQMAQMPFQSTLPQGSDIKNNTIVVSSILFQSTLPQGSDTAYAQNLSDKTQFQSTLPQGSDESQPSNPPK